MRESSWRNYEDSNESEDGEDEVVDVPLDMSKWDSELWQDRDDEPIEEDED